VREILVILGLTTFIIAWKWPGLRAQGVMLVTAAIVAFFASPYPAEIKVYPYLAIDIAGGAYAYLLWKKYREPTAIGFIALSLICVASHWALFYVYPQNANPWIATLNGIYFAMCCMVGGAGYARHHRHLFGKRRDSGPRSSFGGSAR
jgi:hypothetical protein